jgi:hypothetical protein
MVAEKAEEYKRAICIVPRNHYKSTIFTIAYGVYRGLRNPNETGLIIANSATNASHFLSKIRSAFETKRLLRDLFPELCPEHSNRWNKEEACLPRTVDHPEATWEAVGWSTKVTSRHYDWILMDDLVDEDSYESPELMNKIIERFEQRESLLRPPIEARTLIVVANHWSAIDLNCYILRNHPEYHVYYRQAIEDGKPIFPEAYSLEWLQRKQAQNPYTFALQYMNNPLDVSLAEYKPEWLQEYKRGEDSVIFPLEDGTAAELPIGALNIYATVDPRHSLSTTTAQKLTARNAIAVVGIDGFGRRFLLDTWAARTGPVEVVHKMWELQQKWHPICFGIESFGFQKALKPLAEEIWRQKGDKGLTPRVELLPQDSQRSKEVRIRGGLDFFREGKGYIHRSQIDFKDEYVGFPTGRFKDLLDCWAWAQELARVPELEESRVLQRQAANHYYESLQGMGRI